RGPNLPPAMSCATSTRLVGSLVSSLSPPGDRPRWCFQRRRGPPLSEGIPRPNFPVRERVPTPSRPLPPSRPPAPPFWFVSCRETLLALKCPSGALFCSFRRKSLLIQSPVHFVLNRGGCRCRPPWRSAHPAVSPTP